MSLYFFSLARSASSASSSFRWRRPNSPKIAAQRDTKLRAVSSLSRVRTGTLPMASRYACSSNPRSRAWRLNHCTSGLSQNSCAQEDVRHVLPSDHDPGSCIDHSVPAHVDTVVPVAKKAIQDVRIAFYAPLVGQRVLTMELHADRYPVRRRRESLAAERENITPEAGRTKEVTKQARNGLGVDKLRELILHFPALSPSGRKEGLVRSAAIQIVDSFGPALSDGAVRYLLFFYRSQVMSRLKVAQPIPRNPVSRLTNGVRGGSADSLWRSSSPIGGKGEENIETPRYNPVDNPL